MTTRETNEQKLINTEIISSEGEKFNLLCHPALIASTKEILKKYKGKDIQDYINACNQILGENQND